MKVRERGISLAPNQVTNDVTCGTESLKTAAMMPPSSSSSHHPRSHKSGDINLPLQPMDTKVINVRLNPDYAGTDNIRQILTVGRTGFWTASEATIDACEFVRVWDYHEDATDAGPVVMTAKITGAIPTSFVNRSGKASPRRAYH